MPRPLRIAQVAPPLEPVPPPGYGGTERIVAELVDQLHRRGHEVTTFASGDSRLPGRLVPTVPAALWQTGFTGDPSPWFVATIDRVLAQADEFDLIHSHLEWYSPLLARASPVPVVTTFHGRLDVPWAPDLLVGAGGHNVAISASQAATQPSVPWAAVVHNGLSLGAAPFIDRPGEDLAFVGRIAPEKGVVDAIEIALRSGRRLRIGAKFGKTAAEQDYLDSVFRPALARAGSAVEWLGELSRAERDQLFAESLATLMPGGWPEPFGLVAIESLACGTPVVARPAGALPEIVRHGIDGFLARDVDELAALVERTPTLDRAAIRAAVLERFSAERMADGYEQLFRAVVAPALPLDAPAARRLVPILVVNDEEEAPPAGLAPPSPVPAGSD
jgi:glycosyltransferase involved in cell wall biosynthesis